MHHWLSVLLQFQMIFWKCVYISSVFGLEWLTVVLHDIKPSELCHHTSVMWKKLVKSIPTCHGHYTSPISNFTTQLPVSFVEEENERTVPRLSRRNSGVLPLEVARGKICSQNISHEFLQITFQQQLWNPEDDCGVNILMATQDNCQCKILNSVEVCSQKLWWNEFNHRKFKKKISNKTDLLPKNIFQKEGIDTRGKSERTKRIVSKENDMYVGRFRSISLWKNKHNNV